ncbi:MAG: carbohydrate-binding family 9-like protein [Chthonomonadales bacterium]
MRANAPGDLPTYFCRRAPQENDGLLLPAAWQLADYVDFKLVEGLPNQTPRMPTRFAALWTSTHLHLLFQCADTDIRATMTGRDDPLYEEEVVEAFLSPTGDVRRYYEFETNALEALFDAKVYSPDLNRSTMVVDTDWDCMGMVVDVRQETVNEKLVGVRTEWAIPFAAFPEVSAMREGDVWRANFYRIERSEPAEFSAWSPTAESPANFHVPERFGYLEFVN